MCSKLSFRNGLLKFCQFSVSSRLRGDMAMSGAGGEAPPAYRYNLAMVTVLQNEAPFLPEWLEYHALYTVGVEHFYLYDDGSTDELAATLAPYLAAGLATLTNVSSLSPLPTTVEVPFERTPALPVPVPLTLSLTLKRTWPEP